MRIYLKSDVIEINKGVVVKMLEPSMEYTIGGKKQRATIIPDPNQGVFVNFAGLATLDKEGKELNGTFRVLDTFTVDLMRNEYFRIAIPPMSQRVVVYVMEGY